MTIQEEIKKLEKELEFQQESYNENFYWGYMENAGRNWVKMINIQDKIEELKQKL